ncbi:DYLT1 protein, partial [Polyodon spathula]|nr:DYLT1 protein [Polyodon spathula]
MPGQAVRRSKRRTLCLHTGEHLLCRATTLEPLNCKMMPVKAVPSQDRDFGSDSVNCAVMQKSGAGLHTANSCYWDTATDGNCTVRWENRTMYCVVSVFAVAVTL